MTLKKLLQLFCVSKKDSKKKGAIAFLVYLQSYLPCSIADCFSAQMLQSALDCSDTGLVPCHDNLIVR